MKPQIVGWMSKRDASRGADTNYRRLEQDYEFSGGYGLKEPAGWEPLYALDSKDLLILELYREQHSEALTTLQVATGKVRASAAALGLTIAEWEHKFGTRATPCGECHLQPGERCDVCGASSGS